MAGVKEDQGGVEPAVATQACTHGHESSLSRAWKVASINTEDCRCGGGSTSRDVGTRPPAGRTITIDPFLATSGAVLFELGHSLAVVD